MTLRDVALGSCVGILAAVLRFFYMFFPLMNLLDVMVFGIAGYGMGRSSPTSKWPASILLVLPTMLLISFWLSLLGADKLRDGVGVGHLYGAVLIPLAAGLGLFLAGRQRGSSGMIWTVGPASNQRSTDQANNAPNS
jgi:hypothetical protein